MKNLQENNRLKFFILFILRFYFKNSPNLSLSPIIIDYKYVTFIALTNFSSSSPYIIGSGNSVSLIVEVLVEDEWAYDPWMIIELPVNYVLVTSIPQFCSHLIQFAQVKCLISGPLKTGKVIQYFDKS